MTTRVPTTSQEFRAVDALMKESKLDIIKETKLKEVVMEMIIDGQTPIDLKNENLELRKNFAELRRWSELQDEQKRAMEIEVKEMRRELEDLRRVLKELQG